MEFVTFSSRAVHEPGATTLARKDTEMATTSLPYRVTASGLEDEGERLVLSGLRSELLRLLTDHGAVLVSRTSARDASSFERILDQLEPERMSYRGGNSPRSLQGRLVYTSTEYPQDVPITPHNELSFAATFPSRLYFCCLETAPQGGETVLVDSEALAAELANSVLPQFASRGVRYTQVLHSGRGLGRSWQETFESDDPAFAVDFLREQGTDVSWEGGLLRVVHRRPAVLRHPDSGRIVWFNQADQWHWSNLPSEAGELLQELPAEDRPLHATFGDGGEIPLETLALIRSATDELEIELSLRAGDILVLDNRRMAHGRRPFVGTRRVLVAMGGAEGWPVEE